MLSASNIRSQIEEPSSHCVWFQGRVGTILFAVTLGWESRGIYRGNIRFIFRAVRSPENQQMRSKPSGRARGRAAESPRAWEREAGDGRGGSRDDGATAACAKERGA